jgi:hypothetical protein
MPVALVVIAAAAHADTAAAAHADIAAALAVIAAALAADSVAALAADSAATRVAADTAADTGNFSSFPQSIPQILRTSPERPFCCGRWAFLFGMKINGSRSRFEVSQVPRHGGRDLAHPFSPVSFGVNPGSLPDCQHRQPVCDPLGGAGVSLASRRFGHGLQPLRRGEQADESTEQPARKLQLPFF